MAILKIISHGKTNAGTRRLLQYVLDPKKTESHLCAVSGDYPDADITPQQVYQEFQRVRELFGKDRSGGRTYTHGTVAFAPGEITAEAAAEFAQEFVERVYPDHQVLTAVHTDADHIHAHFVVEPVSYIDGTMLHTSKHDLERAKKLCNEMCQARGLSVAQKGHHADGKAFADGEVTVWDKNKWHLLLEDLKNSHLVQLAMAIQDCGAAAESREAFCTLMEQEYGWSVIWKDTKKNLTFVNADGKRVRDTNLSKSFNLDISKEALQYEFARNSGKSLPAQSLTGKTTAAAQANRTPRRREPLAEGDDTKKCRKSR